MYDYSSTSVSLYPPTLRITVHRIGEARGIRPWTWHTIDVTTSAPPISDTEAPDESPRGVVATVVRWFFITIGVASFLVWIYAFSGLARRDPPDLLDHESYATAAEKVCAEARAEVLAVPDATSADSPADRADQVSITTRRLEQMVNDLEELAIQSQLNESDSIIVEGWLADWRTMIADRYRYIEQLATEPMTPFRVTDTGIGERLDRRITRMADTNKMYACGDPGDAG